MSNEFVCRSLPVFYSISTDRMITSLAREDDAADIDRVFAENSQAIKLLRSNDNEFKSAVYLGLADLPPGGAANNLYNHVIRNRETMQISGLLEFYAGYPHEKAIYITELFLANDYQNCGLGKELVVMFEKVALAQGFREIRLAAGLKNWPALHFWIKNGYNTIAMITGDRHCGENGYGFLELTKHIDQDVLDEQYQE